MFQIFLVAGPSGVGKKTFVDTLRGDDELRQRFQIAKPIEAINSRDWKSVLEAFREKLPRLAHSAFSGTVIVKWQARMRRGDFSCVPIEAVSGVWLTLPVELLAAQFFEKHRDNPNYDMDDFDEAKRIIERDSDPPPRMVPIAMLVSGPFDPHPKTGPAVMRKSGPSSGLACLA